MNILQTWIDLWSDINFIEKRIEQQDRYIAKEHRQDKIEDAQLIKKRFTDRLAELNIIQKYKIEFYIWLHPNAAAMDMRMDPTCVYAGFSDQMPQALKDELGFKEFGTFEQCVTIYKR